MKWFRNCWNHFIFHFIQPFITVFWKHWYFVFIKSNIAISIFDAYHSQGSAAISNNSIPSPFPFLPRSFTCSLRFSRKCRTPENSIKFLPVIFKVISFFILHCPANNPRNRYFQTKLKIWQDLFKNCSISGMFRNKRLVTFSWEFDVENVRNSLKPRTGKLLTCSFIGCTNAWSILSFPRPHEFEQVSMLTFAFLILFTTFSASWNVHPIHWRLS